jgi:hypothetical protein
MKLDLPAAGSALPAGQVVIDLSVQGESLRLTAHHAVPGTVTAQTSASCNEVNAAPWMGRLYPAPDGAGADLSLGLPMPRTPSEEGFSLELAVYAIGDGVRQARAHRIPDYSGPLPSHAGSTPQTIQAWARGLGAPFASMHGGNMVVFDTFSPGEREIRLEVYDVDGVMCVARAHALLDVASMSDLLRSLDRVNQMAPAGAAAWDPANRHLSATTVLYTAETPVTFEKIAWAVDRSRALFDETMEIIER